MQHCTAGTRIINGFLTAFVAASVGFSSFSAHALASDDASLIEGAKLCTRYLPRHEREYGIPVHLLAAIASTESGRYHRALGLNLPWPWTINVEGRGYFFDTKEEAIAAVQNFQSRGFQSIDVGCMQVNLHHHPHAFANLDQAFDPAYNVAYAAQFLKANFEEEGSWRKATADYHSRSLMFGDPYAQLVFGQWSRIINKVADARAGRPILNQTAAKAPSVRYHDQAGADAADAVMRRKHPSYHAPHLREISVSHDTTRERGVLVIRPGHDDPPQEQAKLEDSDTFVAQKSQAELVPAAAVTAVPAQAAASPAAPVDPKAAAMQSAFAAAAAPSGSPQIVHVESGKSITAAKGQFQPESHIVRIDDASSAAQAATPAQTPIKSAFVFDN